MQATPEEPRCPFCYYKIEQPKELPSRKIVEFPVGVCENCGVVYVYDATGHNMGSAFIEAILFACNDDDSLAFSLSYGDDYTDAVVGNYDIITHSIVPEIVYNDRYVRGALIFIKLFEEFHDATKDKVGEKIKTAVPIAKTRLRSEKFSKEIVRQYATENRREQLIALADEDTRVMNELKRMLYTTDEALRWQVIDMLGEIGNKVAVKRPDIISKLISNLLQSAAAPGASAWGALEAAGTIVSSNPSLFGEFSSTLLSFLQHQNFRRETTWAIGKIASVRPDLVKYAFRALWSFLGDADPILRGYAAWALGNIGYEDVIEDLRKLGTDDEKLLLFRDGRLEETTVALLSKEAIGKIGKLK
jgi:hypothetical protein